MASLDSLPRPRSIAFTLKSLFWALMLLLVIVYVTWQTSYSLGPKMSGKISRVGFAAPKLCRQDGWATAQVVEIQAALYICKLTQAWS